MADAEIQIVEPEMERSTMEFEQLVALKLFDENHIRNIIKTRDDFELKLTKDSKSFCDFLKYISFESKLMRSIQHVQRNFNPELKLELSVQKNIKRLYAMSTTCYPGVERMWDEYYLFHKRINADHAEIRSILTRKRIFHGHKPHCWIKAIQWERKFSTEPNKLNNVLKLIKQARDKHPTCIPLCIELISVLLHNPIEVDQRMHQVMSGYFDCTEHVNALEFHLELLDEVKQHDFAGKLETQILDDMRNRHFMRPLFYHTIAQRELNGQKTYHEGALADSSQRTTRCNIELCTQVYQNAVSELNTQEMWTYYLDAMHDLNQNAQTLLPIRRRMLGLAYNKADMQDRMNTFHYTHYVRIMYECNAPDELVEQIIKRAIVNFGESIDMWRIYMKHYMRSNHTDRVTEVFEQSRKQLGAAGAPLWSCYIDYQSTIVLSSNVKELFDEALAKTNPEFDAIKEKYIGWAYAIGGIPYTLNVYRRADEMDTVTVGMVQKINDLYLQDLDPNKPFWRELIERAVAKFGATHPEVWLMLINFEVKQGDPSHSSKITQRAKHTLNADLLKRFYAELYRQ